MDVLLQELRQIRHNSKEAADAILQTVVHLLVNFCKRISEVLALECDAPISITLDPLASVTMNKALPKE